MMLGRHKIPLLMILFLVTLPVASRAQRSSDPIDKTGLLASLKHRILVENDLINQVRRRGVSFRLTPDDEQEIRRVGAYLGKKGLVALIEAIRGNFKCPPIESSQGGRFHEKFDEVHISIGGLTATCSVANLQKEHCKVILFNGSPIEAYMECGKVYIDITLFANKYRPPVRVQGLELSGMPPNWDRNFNQDALEIVDGDRTPIYQIIYETPNHIHVNGFIFSDGHLLFANGAETIADPVLPIKPDQFRYKRLFKYPARQYPGQYVDDKQQTSSSTPSSITQTMTNSPGGIQAGRDVIINPQPEPRRLTVAHHDIVADILRAHSGQKLFLVRLGDKEAHFLASQIWQTFRDAGWQVEGADVGQQTPFYGLRLGVLDPNSITPDIAAILSAFEKIEMKVQVVPLNDIYPIMFREAARRENRPVLHVGLRPDN